MAGEPEIDLAVAIGRLPSYSWYHRIELAEGVVTPDVWRLMGRPLDGLWDQILAEQRRIDLAGKEVLDVGCRDGLFSFDAERHGARRVVGIDNDLSRGAIELLIPFFGSQVEMRQLNLYDIEPELLGTFDAILCYGVLYHLRYPVYGLRKLIDVLNEGGQLLIESGMVSDPRFDHLPLVFCPVDDSPYAPDWTSCTFFTARGLAITLESLGMVLDHAVILARAAPETGARLPRWLRPRDMTPPQTCRQFLVFHKDSTVAKPREYWDAKHERHTTRYFV